MTLFLWMFTIALFFENGPRDFRSNVTFSLNVLSDNAEEAGRETCDRSPSYFLSIARSAQYLMDF